MLLLAALCSCLPLRLKARMGGDCGTLRLSRRDLHVRLVSRISQLGMDTDVAGTLGRHLAMKAVIVWRHGGPVLKRLTPLRNVFAESRSLQGEEESSCRVRQTYGLPSSDAWIVHRACGLRLSTMQDMQEGEHINEGRLADD